MSAFVIVKYIHFVGIFLVVGSLFTEVILLKRHHSRREVTLLSKVDAVYGLGALLVLAAGFVMWFWIGKPATYYSANWIFLLKVGVYTVIGLLSIWPTVFFIKNRKGDQEETIHIPELLIVMVRVEMILLFAIPALAILMANGFGNF